MSRCSNLWKTTRSYLKNQILIKNLGEALKLPVAVRWNSLNKAVKQIVRLKDKIVNVNEKVGISRDDMLEERHFEYLKPYTDCTRPVAKALDILQGDVHYGYLLPTLLNVRHQLQVLKIVTKGTIYSTLVDSQLEGLEDRFHDFFYIENLGEAAAVASCYHPFFKLRWLKRLDLEERTKVTNLATQLAIEEVNRLTENQIFQEKKSPIQEDDDDLLNIRSDSDDMNDFEKFKSDERDNLEMLHYYPICKKIFLRYNTTPPSSAAVERFFSYATMMSIPKFNRLSADNFELKVISLANAKYI